MRVFVSEYVCGGGWPEEEIPASLAREGRAMVSALVADLLGIDGVSVCITWSGQAGTIRPSVAGNQAAVRYVSSVDDEARAFREECRRADAIVVIAPEFDGILLSRVSQARDYAGADRVLNCDPHATQLCSDKLALPRHFSGSEVAAVPASSYRIEDSNMAYSFPAVLKPRCGAGSYLTFLINDQEEHRNVSSEILRIGSGLELIQQPYVSGESLSSAVLFGRKSTQLLPVGRQVVSTDGRFTYEGADLHPTLGQQLGSRVQALIDSVALEIPGLRGFVGLDLLLTPEDELILVEINARLTTGYLAWRQWTSQNLAERLLFPERQHEPLDWSSEPLQFRLSDVPC